MTSLPAFRERLGGFAVAIRHHLRVPLYRNGYWLIASTVGSSALGAVFWLIAARTFTTEAVGLGSAAVSAMTFLAQAASLNLFNGLNRFVPRAGAASGRLVAASLTAVGGVGFLAGVVYLLGIDVWSPSLTFLTENRGLGAWFPIAVAAWAIFTVQDGALTGIRATSWVAGSNLAFSAVKIAVLVAVATVLPTSGVFVAWTIPVIPVVVVVVAALFLRLIPRHRELAGESTESIHAAAIARFVGGDYASSLLWMAATNLLPVIVLERNGANAAGLFYIPWTVASVLSLVSRNMNMSLLTELTLHPTHAVSLVYRMVRQSMLLIVPATAVVVTATPLVMRIFGADYVQGGTSLLRLLAFSAIPTVVINAYMAWLRFQRRVRSLFLLMTDLALQILVGSWLLLGELGIEGVGIAWLAAHSLTAAFLLTTELRPIFHRRVRTDTSWRSEP